jgi:hypothetical protein
MSRALLHKWKKSGLGPSPTHLYTARPLTKFAKNGLVPGSVRRGVSHMDQDPDAQYYKTWIAWIYYLLPRKEQI